MDWMTLLGVLLIIGGLSFLIMKKGGCCGTKGKETSCCHGTEEKK